MISLADLQKAIPQRVLVELSNDDPAATELDEAVVQAAMAYALELVEGHLQGRYSLPLQPVPTLLNHIATALAKHWLFERRGDGADVPDAVQAGFKNALKLLENIRDSKLHLGIKGLPDLQPDSGEFRIVAAPKLDLAGY